MRRYTGSQVDTIECHIVKHTRFNCIIKVQCGYPSILREYPTDRFVLSVKETCCSRREVIKCYLNSTVNRYDVTIVANNRNHVSGENVTFLFHHIMIPRWPSLRDFTVRSLGTIFATFCLSSQN